MSPPYARARAYGELYYLIRGLCNRLTSALIKDDRALVMPLEAYKGGLKLYDPEYKEIPGSKALAPYIPYLMDFQKEAKRFYK